MKRNNLFIFQWIAWLSLMLAACSGLEEELFIAEKTNENSSDTRAELIEYTINVETAGTLDSLVKAGSYADVQKLIVTGNIAYEDVNYVDVNMPNVEILDLSEAIYNNESIYGIFLSDSTKIKEISLPCNITSISGYEIYDSNSHSFLDYFPFMCTSLINIKLPEGLIIIGDWAFGGCSSLTNITIPESVTSIGNYAFNGCSSLASINIPEGVTSIDNSAFRGCSSLASINIPESVYYIGVDAFEDCSSLTSLHIPEGVTYIAAGVFRGCSSLTSIYIPESVTQIQYYSFGECSSLTSITIPKRVSYIDWYAFYGCESLTNIIFPDSLTEISSSAFERCSSLTSVTIPENVKYISDSAFKDCSSLTSINIPESVTSIGPYTFQNCSSLTSITLPESVTNIYYYAFSGCSSLTNINIPENVKSIERFAFDGCSSLTSINIPENVKSIDVYTFNGCSSLTNITIPEGVTEIGSGAFYGCSSLTSITIPKSVTEIGERAFEGCNSLNIIKWNTSCPITESIHDIVRILIIFGAEDINSPEGYNITTAQKVIYTKYFYQYSGNKWYTISLPFEPTQITHEEKGTLAPFDSDVEGAKNFWLRELTSDGYKDVTEMEANHAYIIAMPTSGNYANEYLLYGKVTFSAENVTLNWGNPVISEGPTYSMYPTFETVKKAKDIYALNSEYWVDGYDYGHVFVHSAMDINPFEVYVKLNDGTATMRSVLPMSDGKRTAVRGASTSGDASSRGAYGHQKPRKEDM
jgi:hypothetical protein